MGVFGESCDDLIDENIALKRERDFYKAELKQLAEDASLSEDEEEMLIDDDYEALLATLAPRVGRAIARAIKAYNNGPTG